MKKKPAILILTVILLSAIVLSALYIFNNPESSSEPFRQNNQVVKHWNFVDGCVSPVPALDSGSVETVCVAENISGYSTENLIVMDTLELDGQHKYLIRIFETKNNRLVYKELLERDYESFEVGILKDDPYEGYVFWILENDEARMVGFPEHNPIDDSFGEYTIRWKI